MPRASLSASIRLVGRSELRWSPGHPLLTSHGFLRWDLASMNKTFKHSKHCQCKSGFAFKGAHAHGEPGFLCRRQLVPGRLGSGMEAAGSVVVRLAACGLSEGHRSSWGKLAVLKSGHTSSRQEGMMPSLRTVQRSPLGNQGSGRHQRAPRAPDKQGHGPWDR